MKRRHFISKTGLSLGGLILVPPFIDNLFAAAKVKTALANSTLSILPWNSEMPLKKAAASEFINKPLHPTDPQPDIDSGGPSLQLLNPGIRSTIWGPAHQVTISILKNDVWDRRINKEKFTAPTLNEIIEGAYSPANKDFKEEFPDSTRPKWGYLKKEGGKFNPYLDITRYPFPMMKPVGQIIVSVPDLKGAEQPEVVQSLDSGLVKLSVTKGAAKANLEYILSMQNHVYALRGEGKGLQVPFSLRLYRNRDTAYLNYMTPDGKDFLRNKEAYEKDRSWNGPLEAPTSGKEGKYFWIRQRLPAEKTFPQGFEYVMMGIMPGENNTAMLNVNEFGLGTPPPSKPMAEAPGAAATLTFTADNKSAAAFITIATTVDAGGADILQYAKKQLDKAVKVGFDGIVQQNRDWYGQLYDKRENGRIFYGGDAGSMASENIKDAFYSWFCVHDGATRTDMRKYQASAHYVVPEKDIQPYAGLPCYNEVFYTPLVVRNRVDATYMWKQLIEHWAEASRENAREMFGMPGMALLHGFLPPIKPDKYVHTNVALELSVDTMGQMFKTLWDEWDYGGDIKVLKEIYPYLRDMADFYAAYAKKGEDGIYHIIPSMQEESWGILPGFSHSKDCIAAICMFRWGLHKTAEASVLLGKDADKRRKWMEVAGNLPPYPTWKKPEGLVFAGIPGVEPWRGRGEHPWDVGTYPTVLSDDINLDSDKATKEIMIRTARLIRAGLSNRTEVLLGQEPVNTRNAQDRNADTSNTIRNIITSEPERLLNSRSGRIYLFPCLPPDLKDVGFRNFQARGGFLVSANYTKGKVSFTEITARRDVPCSLMNPWPGKKVAVVNLRTQKAVPFILDKSNGECVVFNAAAASTYQVKLM